VERIFTACPLPAGIAGVGFGEAFADCLAVAVGLERLGQIPLGGQHAADSFVRDREVTLPVGIVGVGFGEELADRLAVAVGLERFGQVPLGDQDAADPFVGNREVALPAALLGSDLARPSRITGPSPSDWSASARSLGRPAGRRLCCQPSGAHPRESGRAFVPSAACYKPLRRSTNRTCGSTWVRGCTRRLASLNSQRSNQGSLARDRFGKLDRFRNRRNTAPF